MYYSQFLLLGCFLNFVQSHRAIAQDRFHSETMQGYELTLKNIIFDSTSGNVCVIPLRKYGLKRPNYSVMVNAVVKGDTISYHIPGSVKGGDSFGFRLKVGKRDCGDTLFVIRRTGDQSIIFSKISILAVRRRTRNGVMQFDKAFTAFFVSKYVLPTASNSAVISSYYVENQ